MLPRDPAAPVLIVQPDMTGHRFNYVRILVDDLRRHGRDFVVATTPAGRHELQAKAHVSLADAEFAPVCGTYASTREMRAVAATVRPSLVVAPDGDRLLVSLARRGWRCPAPLRILIMRGARPAPGAGVRGWATFLAKVLCRGVVNTRSLTEAVVLRTGWDPAARQLRSVSDPIEYSASQATQSQRSGSRNLDSATAWFLIAGSVDGRKNVGLVLDALALAQAATDQPLGLAVAGRLTDQVRDELAERTAAAVAVSIDDRHLSEEELDAYIGRADVVVAAHSNEGPSGIVGKAVAARRRILTAGAASLRRDCARLGQGAVWSPLDRGQLAGAALRVLRQDPGWSPTVAGTPDAFAARLLAPLPPSRRWRP